MAGEVKTSDFVDMNVAAVSVALASITFTSKASVIPIYQGHAIAFVVKEPNS